ncbi:5-formyltetrahydrofolate cyclo-ligase [Halomonas sp. McH1-25]|uniref:5-formyltetrahydrofolate cyclo-ligase n=2 Tax=Halomonas TaxID=2745 RepID=UPI001EF627C3|nr:MULTISPECIES: 5-formyltetrahydrofolate cyclo-ligase [unclassified Halomonas]MCG7599602.1 5-formyltetrahydrofolate cyclo-ligase [Halomonas sp. McH1-25]MCP1342125.1 5-formyltetrahydrofolate cyclo-ligase [Halomonas sp. FL8]
MLPNFLCSVSTPCRSAVDFDTVSITDSLSQHQRRKALRRELRQRRRALSPLQRRQAANALGKRLRGLPEVQRARRIAIYLPNDGEIDVTVLLPWLKRRGAKVYLPVLRPLSDNRLWFVHYHADTPMVANRFGIREPHTRHGAHRARQLPPWALDLVLLPLVGFDDDGNRMGMGGGFYDRSFAFVRYRRPRPRLIGVAHDCQRVERLPVASWDVPLDAIVSDARVVRPDRLR